MGFWYQQSKTTVTVFLKNKKDRVHTLLAEGIYCERSHFIFNECKQMGQKTNMQPNIQSMHLVCKRSLIYLLFFIISLIFHLTVLTRVKETFHSSFTTYFLLT